MNKLEIFNLIQRELEAGNVTRDELLSVVREGGGEKVSQERVVSVDTQKEKKSHNLVNILYVIGSITIIIGVGVLIGQNWEEIGFIGRFLASFGLGAIAYFTALFMKKPEQNVLAQVMYVISSALLTLGVFVILMELMISDESFITWGFLFLFFVFLVAYMVSRKQILIVINTVFFTSFYFSLLVMNIGVDSADIMRMAVMVLGASYIFLAYSYKKALMKKGYSEKMDSVVQSLLFGAGTAGILGALISIGGVFDLLTLIFIILAFYLGVLVKSRFVLVVSALFLVGHIINLTVQYFVDSIGWPIALIVIGFLVIGIGYITFYLNERYIDKKKAM